MKVLKVFSVSFFVYFFSWAILYAAKINTLPIQSEDTLPAMFLPYTILQDHTLYLDKYYQQLVQKYPNPDDKKYEKGLTPFYLKKVGSHYVSAFTIITPLLSLPTYFFPVTFGMIPTWENLIFLSHLSSAFIMALAVAAFYYASKRNLLLTFIYAFCTLNLPLVSQAMWQHGAVQLFLILSFHFLQKVCKNQNPRDFIWLGFLAGISVLTRPTAALPVGLMALYYLLTQKQNLKNMLFTVTGILAPLVFFIWYNQTFYQSLENQGYTSQALTQWLSPFPLSFIGVWLSPSKGIFVYSPVFLFLIPSLYLVLKNKLEKKYLLIYAIIFSYTLVMSFWKHWFGGWSFGYRMSSDIIPFMVWGLLPFIEHAKSLKYFYVTMALSFLMQMQGLVFFDGYWHGQFDKGFKNTGWLWSLENSETVYNVKRVLQKLSGFLFH